jgi:hypothetical protein
LVFDATLTFCVFADAPSRYGKFSTPDAFVERACAYTLVCALALHDACASAWKKSKPATRW